MPPVARPIADRFWPKVDRRGPDECWPWKGSRRGFGHGQIGGAGGRGTSPVGAHRVSWEIHYGPVPIGLCVCHRCDNPPCVNPSHLFLGTHADNVADKVAKGRGRAASRPGAGNPNAKLTESDVAEIRRRLLTGEPGTAIARDFGISSTHVYWIRDGKTRGGAPLTITAEWPRRAPSTHCRRGHEMTEANTIRRKRDGGGRQCRACVIAAAAVRRARAESLVTGSAQLEPFDA